MPWAIQESIEANIRRKVIDEITSMTDGTMTDKDREILASRIIRAIDLYNREVAIAALEVAQKHMLAAQIATSAKDGNRK